MKFWLKLFSIILISTETQKQVLAKYLADVEIAGPCRDPQYQNTESLMQDFKFQKINRTTRALSFNATNTAPIDSNVGVKVELWKWGEGKWNPIPFLPFQPNACQILKMTLNDMWTDMMRTLGVKNVEKCPIPEGTFRLDNYIFDTTVLSKFVPFKGRFKYRAILMRMPAKRIVYCLEFIVNMQEVM